MTDATLVIIVAAIPTTIASVAAAVVSLASLRWSKDTGQKADIIIGKAEEIHQLTNSRLSEVTNSLATALKEIDGLKQRVADMKDSKVVADRVAERLAAQQPPPVKESI